jgi:hypothetical protein
MGAHENDDDSELLRSLRLTGADGDERSQALWMALLPCVTLGHALQDRIAHAALRMRRQDLSLELHMRLHHALNHTPLAEERRRQPTMKSREKWLADARSAGTVTGMPSRPPEPGDAIGVEVCAEIEAEQRAAYRRYSFSARVVEFKAAHEIAKVLFDVVRVGAHVAKLDDQGKQYRQQLVAALEGARPEIEAYAAVVRRMNTMERLGGLRG